MLTFVCAVTLTCINTLIPTQFIFPLADPTAHIDAVAGVGEMLASASLQPGALEATAKIEAACRSTVTIVRL
jgi:hypothetical protein